MLNTSPCQNNNGRWKMVMYSDESDVVSVYRELCDCVDGHATADEAKNCTQVKMFMDALFIAPKTMREPCTRSYTVKQSNTGAGTPVTKIIQSLFTAIIKRQERIEKLEKGIALLHEQNYCSMCGEVFDDDHPRVNVVDE